jgi:hypothetical protein
MLGTLRTGDVSGKSLDTGVLHGGGLKTPKKYDFMQGTAVMEWFLLKPGSGIVWL